MRTVSTDVKYFKTLKKHTPCKYKITLIESFSTNTVHNVSSGEVLTPKNCLLGPGSYSMTGQTKILQILKRFG